MFVGSIRVFEQDRIPKFGNNAIHVHYQIVKQNVQTANCSSTKDYQQQTLAQHELFDHRVVCPFPIYGF